MLDCGAARPRPGLLQKMPEEPFNPALFQLHTFLILANPFSKNTLKNFCI